MWVSFANTIISFYLFSKFEVCEHKYAQLYSATTLGGEALVLAALKGGFDRCIGECPLLCEVSECCPLSQEWHQISSMQSDLSRGLMPYLFPPTPTIAPCLWRYMFRSVCGWRLHAFVWVVITTNILLAVGLSRIARGEVVSFCVPAVFWWLLYTFIIFGNSSCIIFAVVRSTLLLLHFYLHSLFFRSYLVSLQYFDDFCSYAALVHVSFLLLCAVLCCFWAFICILCAFVISLCAHSILMIFSYPAIIHVAFSHCA